MVFCPKCGKDVGEFKFCPYCGTAVPEVQTGVWSVGMACPHCGGTQLEGDRCAFCGAQLILDGPVEEEDSFDIPYGSYWDFNRGIHLAKNEMVIEVAGFLRRIKHRVPYEQLVEVVYQRQEYMAGKMIFRWRSGGMVDSASVGFSKWRNINRFLALFYVIKMLSPDTVGFRVEVPPVRAEDLSQGCGRIDWDDLFQRFAPYRAYAVEEVRREYAISEREAPKLVDIAFEERQVQLYEQRPLFAARDLRRIDKEWDRWIELKNKERAERRQ